MKFLVVVALIVVVVVVLLLLFVQTGPNPTPLNSNSNLMRPTRQSLHVEPHKLGYDRPSPKLIAFLRKYYNLSRFVRLRTQRSLHVTTLHSNR